MLQTSHCVLTLEAFWELREVSVKSSLFSCTRSLFCQAGSSVVAHGV